MIYIMTVLYINSFTAFSGNPIGFILADHLDCRKHRFGVALTPNARPM